MYCLAGRRVRDGLRRRLTAVPPDPYGPNSPDYDRRHRETVTTLLNGTVRVDLGDPVGPSRPAKPRKASPQAPVSAASLPEPPAASPSTAHKVTRREHRAITRNP
jgi:hypothetical protein